MSKIPVGTIVRVLSVNRNVGLFGRDAWGVVVTDPGMRHSGHVICVRLVRWQNKNYPPTNGSDYGWYLHRGEFEVVPDDEVPDKIWAELAAARLTQ